MMDKLPDAGKSALWTGISTQINNIIQMNNKTLHDFHATKSSSGIVPHKLFDAKNKQSQNKTKKPEKNTATVIESTNTAQTQDEDKKKEAKETTTTSFIESTDKTQTQDEDEKEKSIESLGDNTEDMVVETVIQSTNTTQTQDEDKKEKAKETTTTSFIESTDTTQTQDEDNKEKSNESLVDDIEEMAVESI